MSDMQAFAGFPREEDWQARALSELEEYKTAHDYWQARALKAEEALREVERYVSDPEKIMMRGPMLVLMTVRNIVRAALEGKSQ